jgi:flagellar assembly protein FliH
MTHPGRSEADSSRRAAAHGDGLVLRGVVMDSQSRALVRAPSEKTADRAMPTLTQASVHPQLSACPVDGDREPGNGRAGYEEGLQKGHAEGAIRGEALGREAGFLAGLEQGRLLAQQQAAEAEQHQQRAKDAFAERLGRLDALLQALPAELDKRMLDAEEDLLALCYEAVARIVGEAAASPDGVRAIVSQSIVAAKLKSVATIHVHPQDLEFLEADQELAALIGTHLRVQWRADAAVELGGCMISAPEGSLDARLETQMTALALVFSGARREQAP